MKYVEKLKNFYKTSAITRPVRAVILAYGYVFSGKKVQEPYNWADI